MSMENDTRLAMMHMSNDAHRQPSDRPRRNNRTRIRPTVRTVIVAFALALMAVGI